MNNYRRSLTPSSISTQQSGRHRATIPTWTKVDGPLQTDNSSGDGWSLNQGKVPHFREAVQFSVFERRVPIAV
jgi:hypothetical protein